MSPYQYEKKEPIFGVAILKVSYELKGKTLAGYDMILKDTMKDLGITEEELDQYIKNNRQLLVKVCRERGLV